MRAPENSFHTPPAPDAACELPHRRKAGFTLIELLCVITIIAILASLLLPAMSTLSQRADSIKCSNNLRTIGQAVQLYLGDHSQNFPMINPAVGASIYPANTPGVTDMLTAFSPYGVTSTTLQCPSDMKQGVNSSYSQYQNSYDWRPTLDDENSSEPLIYGRRFGFGTTGSSGATGFVAKLSKIRQVFDDTQIHFGHMNALYADGHVVYFQNATSAVH
jgi:prepilin-type N-terminal cleavage/methylation domain-containing protein/prepilin-type processing-associated H-X9-DG protein